MKILADENIPLVKEFFQSIGEVTTRPGRTMINDNTLDVSALLVRSVTNVDESLLKGGKVDFVGTCTIGVDHLDQQWLQDNQIAYSSAPGCNANSVVERSEEHTSELQSPVVISYAVLCLDRKSVV